MWKGKDIVKTKTLSKFHTIFLHTNKEATTSSLKTLHKKILTEHKKASDFLFLDKSSAESKLHQRIY